MVEVDKPVTLATAQRDYRHAVRRTICTANDVSENTMTKAALERMRRSIESAIREHRSFRRN